LKIEQWIIDRNFAVFVYFPFSIAQLLQFFAFAKN